MKRLLILGGGTAGTMIANKLRRLLGQHEWDITVVDQDDSTTTSRATCSCRSAPTPATTSSAARHRSCADGVELVLGRGRPRRRRAQPGRPHGRPRARLRLPGDRHAARRRGPTRRRACWAASGAGASSTSTPSRAPRRWPRRCKRFDHGRLVVHITEMPIKCPVAPLEFTFLAEAWLRDAGHPRPGRAGLRDAARRSVHPAGRRRRTWGRCSRSARSTSSPTSWSSASTPSAGCSCRTTSARCRSTCWSRSRSTWAPTSSPGRVSATS